MSRQTPRDPLAPIEFVITVLLALNAFLLLLTVVSAAFGHGNLISETDACVQVRNGSPASMAYGERHPTPETTLSPMRSAPESISIEPNRFSVCAGYVPQRVWGKLKGVLGPAPHPTAEQRWWNRLAIWPPFLYGIGALVLVWHLVRRARMDGFFIPSVARGLSRLGVYLAVGSVTTSVVVLLARKQLLDTLLPGGNYWDIGLGVSWATVVVGVGLVTLGRVMARAVAMREELDATV